MSYLRLAAALGAAGVLYALVPGCSMPAEQAASADADISVEPSAVVGQIARNGTSAPIAHSGSPRLRALSFRASEGEVLDAWVRSTDGDAVAYLADADFKSIARNDDAAPSVRDAHVTAIAERTGTHYVVFRERDAEPATFTVRLDVGAPGDPMPGQACATIDRLASARCGFCGTKKTICERNSAGSLVWSDYTVCQGESGVCVPGEVRDEACGNCGTRKATCGNSCNWTVGACNGSPAAACSPGSVDLTNAGCTTGYRQRSCSSTCSYSAYSMCSAPPTEIVVGPTVGSVSSTIAVLGGALPLLSTSTCPALTLSGRDTAYAYTQVRNPLAKDVTVIVYNSLAPGNTAPIETAIAAYASAEVPTTVEQRRACLRASNSGNAALTGATQFASLDTASKKVTIPAGGAISIYTAAERGDADAATVRVSVKTDAIAP